MANQSFQKLRILDLTRYLPGGYTTQLFADLGAEVIKIEDTGTGDLCRNDEPMPGGLSYYFGALNRNKKSVSLNLKDPDAHAAFMKLCEDADIIVENYRGGVTERLGIDYESVRAVNPRIIYCSISGYGHDDERSSAPLHDLNLQAQSGYVSLTKGQKPPLHLADMAGAMAAVQSILAALYDREVTGDGHFIDAAMFDSFVWWNAILDSRWSGNGGSLSPSTLAFPDDCAYYNLFETKDGGLLSLGLVEQNYWEEFCVGTGHPELVDKANATHEAVSAIVAERTIAEWETWLEGRKICIAPVVDKDEAVTRIMETNPDLLSYRDFPTYGRTIQTNTPHRISGLEHSLADAVEPPTLGRDTADVLGRIGLSLEDIAALAARGAVKLAR